MRRSLLPLVLGLCVSSAAWPQARPPIPSVVLDHMNDLERRCVAAGGRAGQGRFVVAQDFTGDGRLDYLLSEGDYDCVAGRDCSARAAWRGWTCSSSMRATRRGGSIPTS
jgi:hypothetical protein